MENGEKMAEKERDAKSTLWPFFKDFERGQKLGALQRESRASSVSLGFLGMGNML